MEAGPDKENSELLEHVPKVSIQQAFKKFQKQKFYQLKLNKYLKNVPVDRTAPEFKQRLRSRFVQTAHKYIGVPYAQKYHEPHEPLYSAPLFLDCCALIRQCIFDLRQDFGYTLAKWNQAYQFDLLPNQGLSQKDLKPGDLIFYSATYSNPRLKPFPHRMVHVEIYLGEGKSIGSRWQRGTIQVFDSYKFQSKLYHDIEFHYRSIDSWLQGTFRSHCADHKWLDERANQWLSDKFSVFADPSLDELSLCEGTQAERRKVFVGKGNNSRLVSTFFREKEDQFDLMSEKEQFSPHFFFKWVQSAGEIDFYSFKAGSQLVNHIPNISVITHKLELLNTLRELEAALKEKGQQMRPSPEEFVPRTYRLDVMSEEVEFLSDPREGIWIYKPRNLNQGRGIRIIADIAAFKREFVASKRFHLGESALQHMLSFRPELSPALEAPAAEARYGDLRQDGLVQHYVRPLTIRGKKFDIRCFLLINSQPWVVLFNPGYLRLTIQDYTEEDLEDTRSLAVHLTNNCFQNKHPLYKEKKDQTIGKWSLIEEQVGQQANHHLQHQIKRILLAVAAAAKPKLIAKKGTYQLLGCDVLVGHDLVPHLLEVNTNPAMFTDTLVQKELLPALAHHTLATVLELFDSQDATSVLPRLPSRGFEVLHCEQTGFVYGAGPQDSQLNGLRCSPVEGKNLQPVQLNQ